jgi:hypothetical protein
LREVSDRLALVEGIPDSVPETLVSGVSAKRFGDVELDEFDAFLIGTANESAKQAK